MLLEFTYDFEFRGCAKVEFEGSFQMSWLWYLSALLCVWKRNNLGHSLGSSLLPAVGLMF